MICMIDLIGINCVIELLLTLLDITACFLAILWVSRLWDSWKVVDRVWELCFSLKFFGFLVFGLRWMKSELSESGTAEVSKIQIEDWFSWVRKLQVCNPSSNPIMHVRCLIRLNNYCLGYSLYTKFHPNWNQVLESPIHWPESLCFSHLTTPLQKKRK